MPQPSPQAVSDRIRAVLAENKEQAMQAFGSQLHLQFSGFDEVLQEYCFTAQTERWMQNIDGVVHGGFCATIADHAMGIVANCAKTGALVAPTVSLQLSFHRPVPPEQPLLVKVRIISATRQLIHTGATAVCPNGQEHVYFTATATFFCKN